MVDVSKLLDRIAVLATRKRLKCSAFEAKAVHVRPNLEGAFSARRGTHPLVLPMRFPITFSGKQ
jgi:hypothetical protein